MDINEAFRPEDLSKTDFFDFVTAPDIGLDIGVNNNNNHTPNNVNNEPNSNQTLEVYEQFWNSEKPDRLESEIFEDIDRFCWQQHQQNHHLLVETNSNVSSTAHSPTSNHTINRIQEAGHIKIQNNCGNNIESSKNSNNSNGLTCLSSDENLSSTNINMNLNVSDSHVYTLTVLNGNESWLKRSDTIITDAHLTPCLDLDSLLGEFPPFVKSEFVYEDSGFCPTDASSSTNGNCKNTSIHKTSLSDAAGSGSENNENILNVKVDNDTLSTTKSLDDLPTATIQNISNNINITELQNNNNDWHMTNNNILQQNSAESLLRSALQGKGYAKGLNLQTGISLMSSNSIKEDLRGVLFSDETDSLPFADSTLTNSIFEENQSQSIITPTTNSSSNINNQNNVQHHHNHSSSSTGIIVNDMFLSLDSAFTEDFERIKKIASEVQHFVTGSDYSTEIIMEVAAAAAAAGSVPTCDNNIDNSIRNGKAIQIIHQQSLLPRTQNSQQPKHSNIITPLNDKTSITSIKPPTKKFKRNSPIISNNNSSHCNDTNVNINLINTKNNNNNNNNKNGDNLNQNNSNLNNRTSPIHCNGQRKERSLHYCSICSKGFKDKYSVNVHIRTHTGEKPFACTLCGKSFRQKAHLAKHYQTHLAQKSSSGLAKNSKTSTSNRLATSQSLNNNINSATTVNSSGSLRKVRQLSPITTISDANSSISLSEASNNISNSLIMNNVPLPSLSLTGILANR